MAEHAPGVGHNEQTHTAGVVPYLEKSESEARIGRVRELLKAKGLDLALIYYDEFNIGNGW